MKSFLAIQPLWHQLTTQLKSLLILYTLVLAVSRRIFFFSKLKCVHFGSWDTNKEWTITMPVNEEIQAITLGIRLFVVSSR